MSTWMCMSVVPLRGIQTSIAATAGSEDGGQFRPAADHEPVRVLHDPCFHDSVVRDALENLADQFGKCDASEVRAGTAVDPGTEGQMSVGKTIDHEDLGVWKHLRVTSRSGLTQQNSIPSAHRTAGELDVGCDGAGMRTRRRVE